eukprot:2998924-Alexandrium_andersonii.AAC.1
MSASLVGSEMCIRDSTYPPRRLDRAIPIARSRDPDPWIERFGCDPMCSLFATGKGGDAFRGAIQEM